MKRSAINKGAQATKFELIVKNELSEIVNIISCYQKFAVDNKLSDKVRRNICVVIDELLSNIVSYAYSDDFEHKISFSLEKIKKCLIVTIIDDGKFFNPLTAKIPDTGLSLEERKMGGLGIHLVRNIMDEIYYNRENNKNILILHKKLS